MAHHQSILLLYCIQLLLIDASSYLALASMLLESDIMLLYFQADVNVVTFADETGHIIFSGSDDSLCKVRCSPVTLKG